METLKIRLRREKLVKINCIWSEVLLVQTEGNVYIKACYMPQGVIVEKETDLDFILHPSLLFLDDLKTQLSEEKYSKVINRGGTFYDGNKL